MAGAQVGALMGEDCGELLRIERVERAAGEHHALVTAGQAVGGGRRVLQNPQTSVIVVLPRDDVDELAMLATQLTHARPDVMARKEQSCQQEQADGNADEDQNAVLPDGLTVEQDDGQDGRCGREAGDDGGQRHRLPGEQGSPR